MSSTTSGTSASRLSILLALAAPALAAQDGVWERVGGPLPERSALTVAERPGSQLVAEGTRLLRRRGRSTTELACTDPRGTGQIHDLALDSAGLVFVAAQRGLFVVSPEVDALDPFELWGGAPSGSPRSVFVDAQRRVWVATEEQLGAVDPSFRWGRTLTREDGLPGGPPYRLVGERDGALLVETADGTFRYRPDRGAEPVVTKLVVGGKTRSPGETVTGRYGDQLHVAAEGRANGGASFRFRVDRHHVWRELGDEAIEGILPGSHSLEVIAVDRDLRRSAPARVAIEYALPAQYEETVVVAVALVLTCLVTAYFLWRAIRSGGGRSAWLRAPVSAAIAIVFGVQLLAGSVPHAKGWPFIGFSMYTNTYEQGSIIYDERIVGIVPGGGLRQLDYQGVVPFTDSHWQVYWPIIDGGPAFSRDWIVRYKTLHPGEQLIGLQVRAHRRRLTPDGPVRIAPLILSSYVESNPDGKR